MVVDFSGGGDPARSLALLWRVHEKVGRPGKHDLTVDRIVRAAIEVADTVGMGALSMRRVAEALGVGTMSLYTYIPGKAELVDVMLDMVYGEMERPEDVPGGWLGRLDFIARKNWAMYHQHPWMLQVGTTRPTLGPNATAKYDYELRAVAGIGLTEIEMDTIINLVNGHAEGAARRAIEAAKVAQSTGMSDEQWWTAQAPLLNAFLDLSRFPTAVAVGAAVGSTHRTAHEPTHNFDFGLARILDGLKAFVDARAAGAEQTAATEQTSATEQTAAADGQP